jgi:hypothetical protein
MKKNIASANSKLKENGWNWFKISKLEYKNNNWFILAEQIILLDES